MEPHIQYAKTSDGVSIAYAVFGDEPPVVFTSNIWGDVHLIQSGLLQLKEPVERLVAHGRRVIAYDGRGMGSSDRSATDFSPEAPVRDLEAVMDRLDLEGFALCGRDHGSSTAVAYAKPRQVPVGTQSAFRTVLFTDLVGHTEMMQRLGDERGHRRTRVSALRVQKEPSQPVPTEPIMCRFVSITAVQ